MAKFLKYKSPLKYFAFYASGDYKRDSLVQEFFICGQLVTIQSYRYIIVKARGGKTSLNSKWK